MRLAMTPLHLWTYECHRRAHLESKYGDGLFDGGSYEAEKRRHRTFYVMINPHHPFGHELECRENVNEALGGTVVIDLRLTKPAKKLTAEES
jgi:hypothetical protein